MGQGMTNPKTPSTQAKAAGLKRLADVAKMTGVSRQTLTNWSTEKPELFDIILAGCLAKLREKLEKTSI